jgi:hypothetical protein
MFEHPFPLNQLSESPGEIMEKVLEKHSVPEDKKVD